MAESSKKRKVGEDGIDSEASMASEAPLEMAQDVGSNPFAHLHLASWEPMKNLERVKCPKCDRKRKYFCYDCYLPMGPVDFVPKVPLPIECEIVHHPLELTSKSSAIHAKMVSGDAVHLHEFPDVPDWDVEETVLLFPNNTAVPVEELDFSKVRRVVFIDCQWNRTGGILKHPNIKKLKTVKITAQRTYFWRFQSEGPHCLATIEAIYYFYQEFITKSKGQYNHEVDNLMYFYSFFYSLIQDTYKTTKKEFPRIAGYVKLDVDDQQNPEEENKPKAETPK